MASRQNQLPIPSYSRHFYAHFMDYKRFDRDCVGRNNNGGVEALAGRGGDRTSWNLWWCLPDNSTESLRTYASNPHFDRSLPKGPVVPSPGIIGEIKDVYPPPVLDYQSPWQIKKILTHYEVNTGKIRVSFFDMFEHVFRYWNLCMANNVVLGHKVNVILWDVTDNHNPKRYRNESVYVEMLPNDDYILACMELFKDLSLNIDDEIGLYWDPRASTFQFKLLCKTL
ncbi:Uncharacterized protein Fot_55043 [Forsythia ovata]|uniref:Uncharacterized protein n=1 Tax=Forsythia ovata TaxID=205694 RepID=A0ABD1P894_9LAMI